MATVLNRTVSPEKGVNQAMVEPLLSPFLSLSSLRRPPRREGSASARAGASARRPADAPRALRGGRGNPGPTVRSRDCPTLLLEGCSGRSSRFVVAGAARVAGVLLGKGSGSGPAGVRGGSRNALCLQGGSAAFRIRRFFGRGCRVVTPDRIMLAVERARLAQAGAAAQFGSRRDTGPPLFLGQGLAIHERPRDVY